VGDAELLKKLNIHGLFEDPHPGSLALADPPHKGEG